MRPLLAEYESGGERPIGEVRDASAKQFGVSAAELLEQIPSGRAKTFQNRVGWATTYLYRTGLLDRTRRSVYVITERGRATLAEHPNRIDLSVLSQFPELAAFRGSSRRRRQESIPVSLETIGTPDETMDSAYQALRTALVTEVLDRIGANSPVFVENLVLDVLETMGYGGGHITSRERLGRSGDGGIDGVIREDRLGLDLIYVQAKRWENSVGRPSIQAFVGALQGAQASKGVLFTASEFTKEARDYADRISPRVILVDGQRLAELMIDYGVGVGVKQTYELKRVDEDYFSEED